MWLLKLVYYTDLVVLNKITVKSKKAYAKVYKNSKIFNSSVYEKHIKKYLITITVYICILDLTYLKYLKSLKYIIS